LIFNFIYYLFLILFIVVLGELPKPKPKPAMPPQFSSLLSVNFSERLLMHQTAWMI
jgi:hypothetical protein